MPACAFQVIPPTAGAFTPLLVERLPGADTTEQPALPHELPDSRASRWLLTVASGALSVLCCPIPPVLVDAAIAGAAVQLALAATARAPGRRLGRCGGYPPTRPISTGFISACDVGGMPAWLALPMTLLLPAYLCLYPCLGAGTGSPAGGAERAWWTLPALWTLSRWLRATVMTGFPWGNIGYKPDSGRPAGRLGTSGWGVSGGGLGGFERCRAGARRTPPACAAPSALALGVLVWLAGMGLKTVSWTEDAGELDVALLQRQYRPNEMAARNFCPHLADLSATADQYPARVVILPETAIPLFADQVPPGVLAWLADSARAGTANW